VRRADIAVAVRHERQKLVDDLQKLDRDAWDAPSLCADWLVRDVVAHIARVGDFYRRPYIFEWDLLRYGFRLHRALADVAKRSAAGRSPDELIDRLERSRYEETLTFRLHARPMFALAEWIVHGQDVRRPLGMSAKFEPQELIATAELGQKWYAWGSRQRRLAFRLEATDADWSIGSGPVMRGPLEAITMVCFGRNAAMGELLPAS
jgi:uncharacterized protein (TIGR03083 family)